MPYHPARRAWTAVAALLSFAGCTIHHQGGTTITRTTSTSSRTTTLMHVTGPFDVKVIPRPPAAGAVPSPISIMTLDKHFHGALDGPSVGEMLASRTESAGSAVYVALERVTATLGGRSGTFVLAHTGTMTKDGQQLVVTVAPGSGTGELVGLSGTMGIRMDGAAHFYDFDYELP